MQDALGTPIKGFGEETRRRRRQHVAHSIYQRNGKQYIRMQFYIQGLRNKATVHLEKELVCVYFWILFYFISFYRVKVICYRNYEHMTEFDDKTFISKLN